jgi:hypothetical protein
MKVNPRLRRLFSFLLVAAAFAFLGRQILGDFDAVRGFDWRLRPAMLLLSLVALVLVLMAGFGYWAILLRSFGLRPPLVPLARTWFLANLSRYIPGMVWQFVSLAQFGGAAGLRPVVSITSLLVQMGFMVLSAAALGVLLLPGSALGDAYPLLRDIRWAAPAALLAVHPIVIRTLVRWMGRLSRKETLDWQGSWRTGLALLLLAAALWTVGGVSFYLFLRSFVDLPLQLLPTVIAINAVAFLAGSLAFFAPAGLGFKEAALTLLLAGMMPTPVAASLAVIARLWSIVGELLPALVLLPGGFRRGDRSVVEELPDSPPAPDGGPR